MTSVNFKNIITDAKNKSVSASKLLQIIKDDADLCTNFEGYLHAVNDVLLFEGKISNYDKIVEYWKTVNVSQFVAFISKNVKDTRKIDGSSLLGALKTTFSVKELKLLVLPSAPENIKNVVSESSEKVENLVTK